DYDRYSRFFVLFFFFQAEDGIRDRNVTGVQTCALPISAVLPPGAPRVPHDERTVRFVVADDDHRVAGAQRVWRQIFPIALERRRSEERRVGKECRSR